MQSFFCQTVQNLLYPRKMPVSQSGLVALSVCLGKLRGLDADFYSGTTTHLSEPRITIASCFRPSLENHWEGQQRWQFIGKHPDFHVREESLLPTFNLSKVITEWMLRCLDARTRVKFSRYCFLPVGLWTCRPNSLGLSFHLHIMGLAVMLTHRVGVRIITSIVIIIPIVKMSLNYIYMH